MIEYKNLLIVIILKILIEHTDENHSLTQKEILDLIEKEYHMTVERKAVKRNIEALLEFNIDIEYDTSKRKYINKKSGEIEERTTYTNLRYMHLFTDSQLKWLIDGIIFSKYISEDQKREMIRNLKKLSSQHFKSSSSHIEIMGSPVIQKNKEIFNNLDVLEEAMNNDKQISFNYQSYGIDKQFYLHKREDGEVKTYIINPYHIVAANGRYYLIGNNIDFSSIFHYRIDRIKNMKMIDAKRKPERELADYNKNESVRQYVSNHIYMYNGQSVKATLLINKSLLSEAIDVFGEEITFCNEMEDDVEAWVSADQRSIKQWTLQYADKVKIISPKYLVEDIKSDIQKMMKLYYI